jgi:putative spermidine/putrescine transport system permease protein
MRDQPRSRAFYALAAFFGMFVAFLYGPTLTILVLSFQGPQGGLTFPMNGVSTHWFGKLWAGLGIVDIWGALWRSLRLGLVVMGLTVVIAFFAGLAFRKRFRGEGALFTIAVASLIVPSIVVSLGIGLEFRLLDEAVKWVAAETGWGWLQEHGTLMGLYTSALGAHLTWTLPFGATGPQTLRHVVVPILGPSLVGVALFGFTLSFDELARTSQAIGGRNTLPLELQGLTTTVTTPEIYALGTLTTGMSLAVIGLALGASLWLQRRKAKAGLRLG